MREILFRGKRVDNGEWETGSLVVLRKGCSDEQVFIADKMTGHHTPVVASTVGQYTGLTDENGVKIFEGDIVRFTNNVEEIFREEIGTCVFEQEESNFCLQRTEVNPENYPVPTTTHTVYLISNREHEASYEVISNIHDNPELR